VKTTGIIGILPLLQRKFMIFLYEK